MSRRRGLSSWLACLHTSLPLHSMCIHWLNKLCAGSRAAFASAAPSHSVLCQHVRVPILRRVSCSAWQSWHFPGCQEPGMGRDLDAAQRVAGAGPPASAPRLLGWSRSGWDAGGRCRQQQEGVREGTGSGQSIGSRHLYPCSLWSVLPQSTSASRRRCLPSCKSCGGTGWPMEEAPFRSPRADRGQRP